MSLGFSHLSEDEFVKRCGGHSRLFLRGKLSLFTGNFTYRNLTELTITIFVYGCRDYTHREFID